MHTEAATFVRAVVPPPPAGRVIEFGSHNVNGSVRWMFPGSTYIGIDPWPGDGVDVVARCQDYTPDVLADVVITTEALEHDPDPVGHIAAAWRALKPGGLLILTCAGPGRAPHSCAGDLNVRDEHYGNIDPDWLRAHLDSTGWQDIDVRYNAAAGDTYATARRG
jgi:SAM-dependent methyltransferase